MKVALVYEGFGLSSALERDRVLLARGLVSHGADVHVYTTVTENTADVAGTTLHDVGRRVPAEGRVRHSWHYARFALAATRMLRADRARYDVVDVAGTTAWELDVVRLHAVEAAEQRRWPSRGGREFRFARARALAAPVVRPKTAVARAIEHLQFRPGRYDLALAVTAEVAEDLHEIRGVPREAIEVIPIPIAARPAGAPWLREAIAAREDEHVVLFIGHDFARKGLDVAIEALAGLDPRTHLAVIGDGHRGPYERLAAEHGCRDRVHFVGRTEDPESAFAEADVFVLPTREDVWGTTATEAMAAGVPVVTTAVAGVSAAVRTAQAGVVVDEPNGPALGRALAALLSDSDRRQELGARGRAAAAEFHEDRVAARVLEAYERVRHASGSRRAAPLS